MNKMKVDEKEMKLYNYKIEFTKNYLNYIEKKINDFKKEWREDFERNIKEFEENTKRFLDKNRMQIELIQSILNTYKIKGNICIENHKNIKTFCSIPEFKFELPKYGINEKKKYIENFTYNYLIKENNMGQKNYNYYKNNNINNNSFKKAIKIENVSKEVVLKIYEILNELFEINKIEKEEKIQKSIEYMFNNYLSKNNVYNSNIYWYKNIINNIIWEIINYLPNLD